jgi:hypothetical protein
MRTTKRGLRLAAARVASCALLAAACAAGWVSPRRAQAADSDVSLELLLQRTDKFVERFWQQFTDVTCNEDVTQAKLGKNGKLTYQREARFDYLVLLDLQSDGIGVTESRQTKRESGNKENVPLLVTNGFSTMLLIFHPYYQNSFEFSLLPEEMLGGKTLRRVRFQHVRGTRSPSVLQLRGRDYPLDLQGTAWIDAPTGSIVRIEAGLLASMEDVGLRTLHSDVQYAPVRFSSSTEDYWLPTTAEIEAETPRQHWRNIHRFTGYKLFSTEAHEESKPQP